jgi:hypothetical protein
VGGAVVVVVASVVVVICSVVVVSRSVVVVRSGSTDALSTVTRSSPDVSAAINSMTAIAGPAMRAHRGQPRYLSVAFTMPSAASTCSANSCDDRSRLEMQPESYGSLVATGSTIPEDRQFRSATTTSTS